MSEHGLDTFFVRRCKAVADFARELARDELSYSQHSRLGLIGMDDWRITPIEDRTLLLDAVKASLIDRHARLTVEIGILAAYPAQCVAGMEGKIELLHALAGCLQGPDTVALIANLGLSLAKDVAVGTARIDPEPPFNGASLRQILDEALDDAPREAEPPLEQRPTVH